MTVRTLAWTQDGCARFVRPCSLPLETLAAVAAELATRIGRLFEPPPPRVDFFAPVEVDAQRWDALSAGARTYRIAGEKRSCALLVGAADARAIAGEACGERVRASARDAISRIELRVLDRFVDEVVPALESLCGRSQLEPVGRRFAPVSFVQLRVRAASCSFSLGLGFDADPEPAQGPTLAPSSLERCPLDCWARLGTATVDFLTLASLSVGTVLRLDAKVGPSATLNLGPNPIASGEGGVLGARAAFLVHDVYPGAL